jgi:hypothetical protein
MRYKTTSLAGLVALAMLSGCNRSTTFDVSGTVTFKGKPVPIGLVVIEPDAEKGNRGTQTQGLIKEGQFRTLSGYGAIAGPVLITVNANDGVPTPMAEKGKLLFRTYQYRTELPRTSSTLNIEVPAEQAFPNSKEEPDES